MFSPHRLDTYPAAPRMDTFDLKIVNNGTRNVILFEFAPPYTLFADWALDFDFWPLVNAYVAVYVAVSIDKYPQLARTGS